MAKARGFWYQQRLHISLWSYVLYSNGQCPVHIYVFIHIIILMLIEFLNLRPRYSVLHFCLYRDEFYTMDNPIDEQTSPLL